MLICRHVSAKKSAIFVFSALEETTASRALAVKSGESLGLLRSQRTCYERNTVPFRHQLKAKLAKAVLADSGLFRMLLLCNLSQG